MLERVQTNHPTHTLAVAGGPDAVDDPRIAMADVNRQIVAFQSAGKEVPARLLRLTKALTSECIAQSQGR